MKHPERKLAKRFDAPGRCRKATEIVYSGANEDKAALHAAMAEATQKFKPEPPEYQVFFGELHGHTALSDGKEPPPITLPPSATKQSWILPR